MFWYSQQVELCGKWGCGNCKTSHYIPSLEVHLLWAALSPKGNGTSPHRWGLVNLQGMSWLPATKDLHPGHAWFPSFHSITPLFLLSASRIAIWVSVPAEWVNSGAKLLRCLCYFSNYAPFLCSQSLFSSLSVWRLGNGIHLAFGALTCVSGLPFPFIILAWGLVSLVRRWGKKKAGCKL